MKERSKKSCFICGAAEKSLVKYPENFQRKEFDFAARKQPEHLHFQINECAGCGLIFSSPILPSSEIESLYRESYFIEEPQLENMLLDYVDQLKHAMTLKPDIDSLLEVGCSSGFLLHAAQKLGIKNVRGVEPGYKAYSQAHPDIQRCIENTFFEKDIFSENSFDIVCCFQVLDHLLDPLETLREVFRVLKPGGLFLTVNHDIRSWMPRMLGEKCPMYDVEHIYLFDKKTIKKAFQKVGLEVLYNKNIPNSYSLAYAIKMFPLPAFIKESSLSAVHKCKMDKLRLRLPAGNMTAIGVKPKL